MGILEPDLSEIVRNIKSGKGGRRPRPIKVAVPYAPTKKGKAAERAAAGRSLKASGSVEKSSGVSLGDIASVAADVVTAPGPLGPLAKGPMGDVIRSTLKDSAENAIDVVNESETARLLRGEGPRPGGFAAHEPSKKELQLAGDLSLLIPGGEGVSLAGKAGKVIQGASDLKSASKLIEASKAAVKEGGAAEKVAKRAWGAGRGRSAIAKVASKAEPEAVRAARTDVARRAAQAAGRLPKSVRTTGRVAGRAVALPVKRPFTAPIAAQVPAAAISGNPSELGKAFTGQGVFANASSSLGDTVASAVPGEVAKNLVKDAFNLPAVALPSAYLPIAGAVEASKGDSSRLEKLLHDYEASGLLPAALKGNLPGVAKALKEHPLFSALEVSGATAAVGRGAGAAARAATHGKLGGTERPALVIQGMEKYGDVRPVAGKLGTGGARYSPDLLRQLIQRGADRRRTGKRGGQYASPAEAERALKSYADRYAYERQQLQRVHRFENTHDVYGARPKSGRFRTDKASAGVVSLAVQKIIRSPETFGEDLRTYRGQLERVYKEGELTKGEKASNRALVKQIDKAIRSGNPEEIVKSANAFIKTHKDLVDELVSRGLLDPEQAQKAALTPFAVVHMGAKPGELPPTEEILSEMKRHGADEPGFLTHRPRTTSAGGAWYRAFFPERQTLPRQARTGGAAARGTFDASYRALVEQAARTGTIGDAAVGFDEMMRKFAVPAPGGVKSMNQAHDVLRNPDRYGINLPEGVELQPIRVAPFMAMRKELEAAHSHQALLDPENNPALERVASEAMAAAERDGEGPIAFVPRTLFKRLQDHFKPTATHEKVAQSINTAFKGAVLPFSPSFYIGNAVDNWMRAGLAGIGPSDIRLGKRADKVMRDMGEEGATESIIPGAGYGSVKRVQPYRSASQFEGTSLAPLARTWTAIRHTPGPKQVTDLYKASKDFLLEVNSKFTERLPQYGALGKEVRRDLQARTGHWHHALMVSDDALKDLLKGVRNTDKQVQYARAVEDVFGNWGKNGPFARHILSNFVPFWMWARASTRFVLMTLPAHHPIKTAILAAAAEMTEPERKRFGLDKFAEEPLPGYLQGSLPIGGGIGRNVPKYTSFGSFSDYPEFLGKLFFAQGSSPLQALQGLDWKGDRLAKEDGSPVSDQERVWLATLTGAEQFVPGFNLIQGATGGDVGKFSPVAAETGDKLKFLRELSKMQQITVPVSSESSGSSWGSGRQESTSSSWGAGR